MIRLTACTSPCLCSRFLCAQGPPGITKKTPPRPAAKSAPPRAKADSDDSGSGGDESGSGDDSDDEDDVPPRVPVRAGGAGSVVGGGVASRPAMDVRVRTGGSLEAMAALAARTVWAARVGSLRPSARGIQDQSEASFARNPSFLIGFLVVALVWAARCVLRTRSR